MQIFIENDRIKAAFNTLGAETASILDKQRKVELLWQGSAESWRGQATNLFPFIGRLKNKTYTHKRCEYSLGTHGFARNTEFIIADQNTDSVTFVTTHSDETLKVYPFKFEFRVNYTLCGSSLITEYSVKNTGSETMYFGIGGHPGFNLPAKEAADETDICGNKIVFEYEENPKQFIFDKKEILIDCTKPYGKTKEIPLTKKLFDVDAILLSGLKSRYVILQRLDGNNIKFHFDGAPYLAFWTYNKRGAFICFEPWCGLPDYLKPNRELKDKPGINTLDPDKIFHYKYIIEL